MKDAGFLEFLNEASELCEYTLHEYFFFQTSFIILIKSFQLRNSQKKIRAGFVGHLTKLANNFLKLSEKDEDIKAEISGY